MLHFFRKIRKGLVSDNKFSKYLIYAIGEIILVVIGILIALQINNWNQSKKNEIVLDNYKQRLIPQFQKDSLSIDNFLKNYERFLPEFEQVDSLFRENFTGNIHQDSIIKVPYAISLLMSFTSQTTALYELFNTGNLDLFKQEELKDLFAQYDQQNKTYSEIIGRMQPKFDNFDERLYEVSKYNDKEFLVIAGKTNSDQFMNQYRYIQRGRKGHKIHFERLQEINSSILNLLRK